MKVVKVTEAPLKDAIVEYVGDKLQPENDEVTYDMVANVLAEEFPEFMVYIAEENYIRGWQVGYVDAMTDKRETNELLGTEDFRVAEQ
jgi:hypothetical protein